MNSIKALDARYELVAWGIIWGILVGCLQCDSWGPERRGRTAAAVSVSGTGCHRRPSSEA